jgi:hypothetical protein
MVFGSTLASLLTIVVALALTLAFAPPAAAQSINVDFGDAGDAPSAAYGAAGLAGVWNEIGHLPDFERADLVGLDGAPIAARIYGFGPDAVFSSDDAATAGDDDALVDDMLIGLNDPVDVCIWIENLVNGDYVVTLYALTPNNAALQHRVRVDDATPGPTMIGGAWPGGHQEHLTFERFAVTVTNGKIGLHSGLYGGNFESGLNGIQIVQGATGVGSPRDGVSGAVGRIERIYPNPAAGAQTIELSIADAARGARLDVFDAAGRLVWRAPIDGAGPRSLVWSGRDLDGRRVAPGAYFLRLDGGSSAASPARSVVRVR